MMMMMMIRRDLMLDKYNKIYRLYSKKKNKSKSNKFYKIDSLIKNTKDNNTKKYINDHHNNFTIERNDQHNSIDSMASNPFPWKHYDGARVSYSYYFSFLNLFLQYISDKDGKSILNYNDIAMNSKNLFKEATISIFQHKLIRMHPLNSKQKVSFDTLDNNELVANITDANDNINNPFNHSNNTISTGGTNTASTSDTNTASSTASTSDTNTASTNDTNTASKNATNNDPFPLNYIFESKLASLYQDAIEKYSMNPNRSIFYQLHDIKSSKIYDAEFYMGISIYCSFQRE